MALCVSILEDSFDALARSAVRAASTADLVELRLERLPEIGERELADLLARIARPVIAAVHGPGAYGTFAGTPAERRAILERAARAGAAYVDVDWREAEAPLRLPPATRRIVSRHERAPKQPACELGAELAASAREGDLRKLVVEVSTAQAGLEVLELLERDRGGLIAFAAGSAGSFTRVLAPILGSPWTYAAADPERGGRTRPTAPGQLTVSELRAAWPARGPRASTRIFALLGRPVAHSISPRVHTRALRSGEVDAVFVALDVGDVAQTLALTTAWNWSGFAVTAPHKQAAFALANEHDAASTRARACNTLVRAEHGWRAFNTDVDGVRGALTEAARGAALSGKRALVLGTGGAARAALVALEELGARVTLAARDFERARALAQEFAATAVPWDARAAGAPFDVVVQCTSSASAELLPESAIAAGSLVLDAVYRPLCTPLLESARRRGARIATGADWFIHQALRQFELFTGRPAPAAIVREEVQHALA